MLVRLMIIVSMAVAGSIVATAEYPNLMAKAREAPQPKPMPIRETISVAEPLADSELEAGRARWHEILAHSDEAADDARPHFAGGRGRVHQPSATSRRSTPHRRGVAGRASARASVRERLQRPSIFEQSRFGASSTSRAGSRSGLGAHRRFGFAGRPAGIRAWR